MSFNLNSSATDAYRSIMDSSVNAFSNLPKIVRFQYMSILAFMWSGVFALWLGNIMMFGPSVFGHMFLLLGVFFTADTFQRVRGKDKNEAIA